MAENVDPNKKLRDEIYILSQALNALDALDNAEAYLSREDMPPIYLETKGLVEQAKACLKRETNAFKKTVYG